MDLRRRAHDLSRRIKNDLMLNVGLFELQGGNTCGEPARMFAWLFYRM
jgi:hypothetical protein